MSRASGLGRDRVVTLLLAALLGVGLASRAQFILLLPLVYLALGRHDFSFAGFGVLFMFFGVATFWPDVAATFSKGTGFRMINDLKSAII